MTTKISTTNIQDSALTTLLGPKVTTIVYPGTETATDTNGGETINLTGNGFQSGCSVLVGSTAASVVTFISSTQISFTAPAMSANTYVLYVINPDGGTAISIPGISYSGTPNWTTSAGSLGTAYEAGSISATLAATGDAPITYTLASGTLPTGSTLSTGGSLSGTAPATASATTYNFTISAKDAQNQTTNRAFSLTINPDVVTWSSPASSTTYSVFTNSAIANVTMSATSAAGGSITYTADTLPTGLSITGANIAGTPTVVASTTTVLTATATSTRTATRTINWVVSLANDTYWKNTTLLLNGETTVTPFISDASTNSFGLTINGDTKPTLFSPYQGDGYYSNYFDGTGDYLSLASNSAFDLGTGDFTIEFWMNTGASQSSDSRVIGNWNNDGWAANKWSVHINHSSPSTPNQVAFWVYNANSSNQLLLSSSTVNGVGWVHVAISRSGTSWALFINGSRQATATSSGSMSNGACPIQIGGTSSAGEIVTGYISDIRMVKGTAVYSPSSTNITVPTTPLTAIANTQLLTCQSNRLIDNSTNAFTITKNGDVSVSPAIPFTANASYSTYGSAYFDGTGDYLTLTGSSIGSSNYTVEAWICPTSLTAFSIFSLGTSDATGNMVFHVASDGSINLYADNASRLLSSAGLIKANQWQHVALVRNGTTSTIYVNGVSAASSTNTYTSTSTAYQICAGYGGLNTPITGYISNLRVVNGTAVYTSTFTPPTTPLTAITNTSLLTLQYNGGANNYGIIDNSNFNNIITRNGNTSQGTFSPYSVTGYSNYFNGSSDYFTVAATSTQLTLTGNWTIEFWTNSTQTSRADILCANYTYTSTGWFMISLGLTGSTSIDYCETGGGAGKISGTLNRDGLWHHVALTKSGTSMKLFIDGTQTGSTYTTSQTQWGSSGNGWIIGDQTSSSTYYQGYISNFRALNGTALYTTTFTPSTTPLTPVTNTTLLTCQSNRFIDNSPNNLALTTSGTPSVQAFGPFGSISEATPLSYSNYFAGGASDYLTVTTGSSQLNLPGDFTVELWFYETNTTPTIPRFAGSTSGGFACGINAYDGNATRKLDWRATGSAPVYGVTAITTNGWHHAAYVKSGSTFRIFLDGVLEYYNGSYSTTFTSTATYIGSANSADAAYSFRGYISNLRVVKGTAVYTTASTTIGATIFTPGTSPLTAIANTALLTCQSTRIIDNSTNALTMTGTGTYLVKQFNPFGYTAQSATSYTPSLHGGSAYFDGTGDYLTSSALASNAIGSGNFTIECWAYPITLSGQQGIVNITNTSSSGSDGLAIYFDTGSKISFWVNGNGGTATTTATYTAGTWYHIALVRSGSTNTLYVNGVSSATNSSTPTSSTPAYGIGRIYNDNTSYSMNGYISDIRITKGTAVYTSNFVPPTQTLTNYSTTYPSSLLLNFTNGGIIDYHSSNVLETVGNAQLSTSVKKYNNGSIYFDGTGDYINIPYSQSFNFGTGDFTVECWANITYVQYSAIISSCNSTMTSSMWLLGFSNTAHIMTFNFDGGGAAICGADYTAYEGVWTHIAASRSGTTLKLFFNGTQVQSVTNSTSFTGDTANPITIGRRYNNQTQYYMNGYIDDLRITNGYARYTANFTAPTSALITK